MDKLGTNPPPKSDKPSYPTGTKDNSNLENIFAKNKKEANMNNIHKTCMTVRGIKTFKCLVCDKEATNYSNGIMVCDDCCSKKSICKICGEPMNDKKKDVVDIGSLITFLDNQIKGLERKIMDAKGDFEYSDSIQEHIDSYILLERSKASKRLFEELRSFIINY